jgi:parallel beta-helix repeat protein
VIQHLSNTMRRAIIKLVALSIMLYGSQSVVHAQLSYDIQLPLVNTTTLANAADGSCSLYVSPTGMASNSGAAATSPLTLREAAQRTKPGDVVCLQGGTYNLTAQVYLQNSGSSSAWIIYKSYNGTAVLNWNTTTRAAVIQTAPGIHHIEIRGLSIDGKNYASSGLRCDGSTYLRLINNTLVNNGTAGIATQHCDYITITQNKVYHSGYTYGWASGITLHEHEWSDRAPGFHSYVVGNIVSGSYDSSTSHSEGHGIITDQGDYLADTPPILIANNLVYQNGGSCIASFRTTNNWVINNTCYANSLDGQIKGTGSVGEYSASKSTTNYYVNNVVQAWSKGYDVRLLNSSAISFYRNTWYGGKGLYGVPTTVSSDPKQLRQVKPLFQNPIPMDATADGQYRNALHPNQVGNRFQLQASSPLLNAGIDPRTIPGLTAELKAGIERYLLTDLKGIPRPQGAGFDIGAYEYIAP